MKLMRKHSLNGMSDHNMDNSEMTFYKEKAVSSYPYDQISTHMHQSTQ